VACDAKLVQFSREFADVSRVLNFAVSRRQSQRKKKDSYTLSLMFHFPLSQHCVPLLGRESESVNVLIQYAKIHVKSRRRGDLCKQQ
jgi:hypothetical protein